MGQLLAVGKMVTGSVGKIGSIYTIDIKLIDIKTGQIQLTQSEDVKGSIEDVLLSAVPKIADFVIKGAASMSMTVGYLSVTSEPSGASVQVNGQAKGTTPLKGLEVEAGECRVALALDGFAGQERTVTVLKGRTQDLSFTLSPTSERLAAQKEQAGAKRKTLGKVLRWTGVALAAGGIGAATFFWLDADSKYESYMASSSSEEAPGLWEQTDQSALLGNISAIIGGVGALALGVSFAF
jgi:hypothetical protein